jgi:hypothetical protein
MTAPPLPDVPCVRCRLDYGTDAGTLGGSRFYLSYTGSAPTGADCIALATGISVAAGDNFMPVVTSLWALTEVDVLDIASDMGSSGQWTGTIDGGNGGTMIPNNCSINVEFDIARRYRGGKPRMFLPPASSGELTDQDHWSSTALGTFHTAISGFFTQVEALTIGAMGTLNHVNLSYYKGFTNVTNSSGRTRAAPKYRTVAMHDNVEGYAVKAVVGSQRRRRTATTY